MALTNKIFLRLPKIFARLLQQVSPEFMKDFTFVNTTRLEFDWSMETMRLLVGLTNNALGDAGRQIVVDYPRYSHPTYYANRDSVQRATSFPGFSLYLEKVPWVRLVTCLLDCSRFRRCD